MANPYWSKVVAEAWEQTLDETPDVFASDILYALFMGKRILYRDYLDKQPRNWKGELIPRIVTVRRNLRRLGNIRLNPRRLP